MSFEKWLVKAEKQVASGNNPNLYRWIYIGVDSVMGDEVLGTFDLTDLQDAGLDGWDVVAVIPKTIGITLTNMSTQGNTWGGGLGGNVAGVYVILSKEVFDLKNEKTLEDAKRVVNSLLAKNIDLG